MAAANVRAISRRVGMAALHSTTVTQRGSPRRGPAWLTWSGATGPEAPFQVSSARDGAPRGAAISIARLAAPGKAHTPGRCAQIDATQDCSREGKGPTMQHVFARAKAIVLTPSREWRAIEREHHDPMGLFTGYVAILAAIPALSHFIGA